ncbi:MAG TPA: tRNA epoxyqueuosine(34) reductase QueG [Thermoanaerobaculia bacterium]|nr:tRNA epoxyqueuosine(34) reductase QueG [Thermoanaerobaculia bacterium]
MRSINVQKLSEVWPAIERVAREHGVVRLGASGLDDAHAALFEQWIARGDHATMSYMAKNAAIRTDPHARFPWAKSVITILVPYAAERPDAPANALSHHIARYALGDDYHDVLDRILREVEQVIEGKTWRYVDTGPLSDRAYAAQAGLGWIGKNGMLIDQEIGSYTFIGTLLTSLENDIAPHAVADRCGTCTRCIDACPTDAIRPDRTVASADCISYATIEHRGPLEIEVGSNAFGCDICQEVCPWNRDPAPSHEAFAPRDAYRATPVTDLLRYEQADFSALFRKSAVKRAKLAGMQRNVLGARASRPQSSSVPLDDD